MSVPMAGEQHACYNVWTFAVVAMIAGLFHSNHHNYDAFWHMCQVGVCDPSPVMPGRLCFSVIVGMLDLQFFVLCGSGNGGSGFWRGV